MAQANVAPTWSALKVKVAEITVVDASGPLSIVVVGGPKTVQP